MKTMKSHDKGNIGLIVVTAVSKSLRPSIIWNQRLSELLPQFAAAEVMNKNQPRSSISV